MRGLSAAEMLRGRRAASLRADEIKLWLTPNQSLVIVCTQASGPPAKPNPSQQGRKIWLLFYRKFINCLLKHCEYGRKVNLSTKRSDISELEYNLRNCSEIGKKLLEIREVAKKLPSNLWKALSLGARGNRGREARARYNRQREERKVAGCSSSTGGGSFGPPASPLACVTCIPYS